MRRVIDCHKAVVIGARYVVDPGIAGGDLMKRIIGTGRKLRIVGVNFPDLENAGGRSPVPFFLLQPGLIRPGEAITPGDTVFSKQHVKWTGYGLPVSIPLPFKEPQIAMEGIPGWCDPDDELRTFRRNSIGTSIAATPGQWQQQQ